MDCFCESAMAQALTLPTPNSEQRRVAAGQFDRANQVIAKGDFDYGIQLLVNCCKLDPGNPLYRKTLRATQKVKYKNNLKGSMFAAVTTATAKLRLKKAVVAEEYVRVLELGEEILSVNPWDVSTQMALGKAFSALGQNELGVWSLEQAYQKAPEDLKVKRALARMYEKVGNFTNANALWTMIRKADPTDEEANRKVTDLAANETISKGKYEAVLQTGTHSLDETRAEARPVRIGDSAEQQALGAKDRYARDIEQLEAKIKAEPQEANHYHRLAGIYRKLEKWDRVHDVLEKGIAAAGNQFELVIELAEAAIHPFRANLAVAEVKLQAQPEDAELKQQRVQLLKEINSRELEIYRRKADRYPTDMNFRLEVGVRLLHANQIEEAIQELQAARTDPRLHWKALMYLGFCFKMRKNWRLAQRNFEEALRGLPPAENTRRKEILYQLATGCADASDFSAAIEWAYELANEDFNYKNIGQLIDLWQARLQGTK
jgi:Flp pilus assembly protein TadD